MSTSTERTMYPYPPRPRWATGPPMETDPGWTAWERVIGKVESDVSNIREENEGEITVQLWRDDDVIGDELHGSPEYVWVAEAAISSTAARRLAAFLVEAADILDGS